MKGSGFDTRVVAALVVTVVFWASSYASIRVGLEEYGPGQVALFRLGAASVVLAVYAALTRMRMPDLRDLPAIAGLGFLAFAFYHAALNYGELTVASGPAGVLIATAPVITALLAVLFLGESLRALGWAGMGLSFVGAAVISLDEGRGFSFDGGAVSILLAALCVSVYFVLQKPFLRKYGALAFTTYAIWAGTVFSLVFLPGLLAQAGEASVPTTLTLVYLGVFPTAVGYVTYAYAFSRMPASRAASFLYVIPVMAYVIAWLWLGEVPTLLSVVGGVLTLAGVALVNVRGRRR
ncbi:MAG TPA: DMT family transporter [Rubrobacteraceae bacterium]|nr:DMT family transporter [Rubrobacteraceae bacterium]